MDRKSFIQFLITSAFVLVGWYIVTQYYPVFSPSQQPATPAPTQTAPEKQSGQESEKEQPSEPKPEKTEETTTATTTSNSSPPAPKQPEREQPDIPVKKGITLGNKYIKTTWTNEGAALQTLQLKKYNAPYSTGDDDKRPILTLLRDFQSGYYSDVIEKVTFMPRSDQREDWTDPVSTANVVYELVEQSRSRLVFRGNLDPRLAVKKIISIGPEDYHYKVQLQFINRTDKPLTFTYRLRSAAGIERENLESRYLSTAVGVRYEGHFDVQLQGADNLLEGNKMNESTAIGWAGIVSQYFVSMTWPRDPQWIRAIEQKLVVNTNIAEATGRWDTKQLNEMSATERREYARSNGTAVIISTEQNIPASGTMQKQYRFVAAPKLHSVLKPYGEDLANDLRSGSMPWITWVISFGTLSFLTPIMVSILEFFYGIIPNYGVAIILLTVLVRLILHPLTKSGQVSMHKMRLLQPKIQELQKKHGDNREKLVQEQMQLYSKYGVHPMSGCWPMFLQMPVFVSLFTALRTSVQLRQATFIPGWITDLSQADTVWHFPFSLPILGNELNILPFIMVVAWMLNQHLTPKPSDPKAQQQQKIMKWLPVLFAVMFYQFASGLLLYITASSSFAALQNMYIRNQVSDLELKPVGEESPDKEQSKQKKERRAEPEKKGFMGKLMDKLEEQQKNSQQIRKDD